MPYYVDKATRHPSIAYYNSPFSKLLPLISHFTETVQKCKAAPCASPLSFRASDRITGTGIRPQKADRAPRLAMTARRCRSQTVKKPARLQVSEGRIPSIGKGKHACQRVFPALFALFALLGGSPAASQKPKITRKSIAGRCGAVLSEQKCVQTRKDPQRILAVLSRGLTQYGRISARQNRVCPCQSMVV